MEIKHFDIQVSGRVQGVWFRVTTKKVADEMEVKGFVKNKNDGTVYIEAESDTKTLMKFTRWCHQGPTGAQVEQVSVNEAPVKNYTDFRILQ